MSLRMTTVLCAAMTCVIVHGAEPMIESSRAAHHIGALAVVCGTISEVRPFAKGVYLNVGPKFPSQHLGLLIWSDEIPSFVSKFGGLPGLQGKNVCARGVIESYRNMVQIKLGEPRSLVVSR
jgi:hypothetical protein